MGSLWMSLAEKSILTDANIRSMKLYIAQKFPGYSSARRANILANSIHRHMDTCLPSLDEVSKLRLRTQLLQKAYSQNNFRIASLDIFEACMELGSDNIEILQPLEQWVRLQSEDPSPEEIAPFIQKIRKSAEIHLQSQRILRTEHDQITLYFPIPTLWYVKLWKNNRRTVGLILLTLMLSFIFNNRSSLPQESIQLELQSHPNNSISEGIVTKAPLIMAQLELLNAILNERTPIVPAAELTSRYVYSSIEIKQIRQWLKKRDSMLANEPYLSTIIAAAKQHNIHPFLLLAIAGQEQGLVPIANNKALQIANNPFNVHHSWQEYNTDIADSARIAAETILNLVKGRPEDIQPLEWINRKYAEDPKWHLGVEAFFKQMLTAAETTS